jgi:dTDP-glucose 4,6-dehydratase
MGRMNADRPLPAGELEFVVKAAEGIWGELKGQTLLMTGATGFFGRWLMESLLEANERQNLGLSIVALSRDPDAFLLRAPHLARKGLRWVKGSVTTLFPEHLGEKTLHAVIHLATEADMAASANDPRAAAQVIIGGTQRVLDVAASLGTRRFLYTSSGAAYGPQPPAMPKMSESYGGFPHPDDRSCIYSGPGEAKRQAELLCKDYAHNRGLCAVIARCFTFAGPALPLDSKFAFGNFMGDALEGKQIVIRGDGTAVRSYLYAADLAVWLWTLLLRGASGRHYNVGSEQPVSMRGLAEIIAREMGASGIDVRGEVQAGAVPERYVPSTARARDEIGLKENFSLSEMVRRTASWHRANGKH